MAAMMVCASSRSICRDTLKPNRLRFSCRWIMVMTRAPCSFSIAAIACARFSANHRPIRMGCSASTASRIHISEVKSKDIRVHSAQSTRKVPYQCRDSLK